MNWTQESAQWAIAQLDACKGDVGVASYETGLTLRSLGHYRHRAAEAADRWFRQLVQATPERVAERVAKVRAIAAKPAPVVYCAACNEPVVEDARYDVEGHPYHNATGCFLPMVD